MGEPSGMELARKFGWGPVVLIYYPTQDLIDIRLAYVLQPVSIMTQPHDLVQLRDAINDVLAYRATKEPSAAGDVEIVSPTTGTAGHDAEPTSSRYTFADDEPSAAGGG